MEEEDNFLPVCDLLFNLVSVTAYFCDVSFAAIAAYGLLREGEGGGNSGWFFCAVFVPAAASLLICQVLSLR